VLELKRRGVAWLDSRHRTTHGEGIAHFKLGLTAARDDPAGTFL